MIQKALYTLALCLIFAVSFAQSGDISFIPEIEASGSVEPFLFTTSTMTPNNTPWIVSYSGSYGNKLSRAFGFNGIDQQIGVKGYLGHRFTLYSYVAMGIENETNSVVSAQRAEIIRDFLGGKTTNGLRVGVGVGGGRDYSGVFSFVSRVTGSFESKRWKLSGNLLFEKALSDDRDELDFITSFGVQYSFSKSLCAGIETIGEDLEGLWDEEEAEGGAKIMLGPSLNYIPKSSRFSFSMSGGPVIRATQSEITNPNAIRELPTGNGMILRARMIFNISGS